MCVRIVQRVNPIAAASCISHFLANQNAYGLRRLRKKLQLLPGIEHRPQR